MCNIIILAAGKGTRMKSSLPKVLHLLGGKPMIDHVVEKALALEPKNIYIVIGHQSERLREHIKNRFPTAPINLILQEEQLGTAHAVSMCLPFMLKQFQENPSGRTLILYGDVPLVDISTLKETLEQKNNVVLTARLKNPTGYGRIIRKTSSSPDVLSEKVEKIIEEKHLSPEQKRLDEINTGVLCMNNLELSYSLEKIEQSLSGEYYLTDIVEINSINNCAFSAKMVPHFYQFSGINDPVQLADMERYYQSEQTLALMQNGVRMADPDRVDIRGTVTIGSDVFIDIGVILIGNIHLSDGVVVGPYSVLENVIVGAHSHIFAYSHLNDCVIGAKAKIGPYARIRPGTTLADEVHIGNFVEVKNSVVGKQSKANHLAYIGDADIGERVNVGAGTITCNYDGVNKFRTIIEDDVFIGSDTQLVAPITVERGATLGAGTTLTKNAPANQLTISRAIQKSISNWTRPTKKK